MLKAFYAIGAGATIAWVMYHEYCIAKNAVVLNDALARLHDLDGRVPAPVTAEAMRALPKLETTHGALPSHGISVSHGLQAL